MMAPLARFLVITLLLTLTRIGTCFADPSEDRAAAQALFDEGRSLVKSGQLADACPKFEESQRLDPSIGTQLNLADCYERVGKTASAWTLYIEVGTNARKAGQPDRASLAAARASSLQTTLSRLTLVIPEAHRVTGLVVERGTIIVGRAQWGASIPVDPGTHVVKVSAPGKQSWQTMVVLDPGASAKTIMVPALADAIADPETQRARSARKTQRTIAYVAGGVGVVGLVAGSIFGLRAVSQKSDAGCDGNVCGNDARKDTYEQAQRSGTLATIGLAAGGAALAAGVVLYFTAPRDPEKPDTGLRAQASAGPFGATILAGAAF